MNNHLEDNIDLFCLNEIEDTLLKLKESNKIYAELLKRMEIIENEYNDFLENNEDNEKIRTLQEYIWLAYKKALLERDAVYRQGVKDGIAFGNKVKI